MGTWAKAQDSRSKSQVRTPTPLLGSLSGVTTGQFGGWGSRCGLDGLPAAPVVQGSIRQSRRKGASASQPERGEPETGPSLMSKICIHHLIGKGRGCQFTKPSDSHWDPMNPSAGKVL